MPGPGKCTPHVMPQMNKKGANSYINTVGAPLDNLPAGGEGGARSLTPNSKSKTPHTVKGNK